MKDNLVQLGIFCKAQAPFVAIVVELSTTNCNKWSLSLTQVG